MKKTIIYILLLISHVSWSNNVYELFNTANKYYGAEKYEQAIKFYEAAAHNGTLQSAELYFNLGNCYYKLHKVAPAIFYFEKAAQLKSNDIEIKTNLEFAQKMAIDDIKIIPQVGFKKLLHEFTSIFCYDTWAFIAVAQSGLFLLFFVGYYFSGASLYKRIFFIAMFLLVISIFISLFAAYCEKKYIQNENSAIVFAEIIAVKTEPKKSSKDAFILHEGAKVFITDSVANWKKIQLTDETAGWIEEKAIKKLQ